MGWPAQDERFVPEKIRLVIVQSYVPQQIPVSYSLNRYRHSETMKNGQVILGASCPERLVFFSDEIQVRLEEQEEMIDKKGARLEGHCDERASLLIKPVPTMSLWFLLRASPAGM